MIHLEMFLRLPMTRRSIQILLNFLMDWNYKDSREIRVALVPLAMEI